MKLERILKGHYSARIESIDLPEMTAINALTRRGAATRPGAVFDMVLNCAMHATIALVVVIGLPGLRKESPLAMQITRVAVEVSLDKHIESRIKLLSENIIRIRNTR